MNISHRNLRTRFGSLVTAMALVAFAAPAMAATVTIVPIDDNLEGFNDNTQVLPVGGNLGTTVGEQRLNALQFAADTWAATIDSEVEIRLEAAFNPLGGQFSSAVLGYAGPESVFEGFPGAEFSDTYYPSALADKQARVDLDPDNPDVTATFNTDIDGNTALGNVHWYYGLDANAGNDVDFVSVALHELAHGLGFFTLVGPNGAKFFGKDDVFMRHLQDRSTGKTFPAMTNHERAAALTDTEDLHWNGAATNAATRFQGGCVDSQGRVAMYAPSSYAHGESTTHFDPTCEQPEQLMEPFYTGENRNLGLAIPVMDDLGWDFLSTTTTTTTTSTTTTTLPNLPNPVLSLRHRASVAPGQTVRVSIKWQSPGVPTAGVEVTVPLPETVQLAGASGRLPVTTTADEVIFQGGILDGRRRGAGRLRLVVLPGTELGTVIPVEATFTDNHGRRYTVTQQMVVEQRGTGGGGGSGGAGSLGLSIRGTQNIRNGGRVRYSPRYTGATGPNALSITIPDAVTINQILPPASSVVDNIVTWNNVPAGRGQVSVRGIINLPAGESEATYSVPAQLADGSGQVLFTELLTNVGVSGAGGTGGDGNSPERQLSLTLNTSLLLQRGALKSLNIRYTGMTGNGTLLLDLPSELILDSTNPAAVVLPDGTLRWEGLTRANGSLRVKAIVDQAAQPGATMTIAGALTDDVETATASISRTVR